MNVNPSRRNFLQLAGAAIALRIPTERHLCAIDLRLLLDQPGDYAHQIEPSGTGAAKIARAIVEAVSVGNPEHGAVRFGAPAALA